MKAGRACSTGWDDDQETPVLRRLPLIICSVVVVDLLLLVTLSCQVGWRVPLFEFVATTGMGVFVIVYYEWRWSATVAKCLELEAGLLDAKSLERMLLLVAGIILLIPGLLTDLLGLVLLVPWVRRQIAVKCNLSR
jgi:UPF0716 protein FxsA